MTFKNQLKKLKACQEALEWVGNKTIEEAWETCKNSHWMIWVLSQTDLDLIDPVCDMAEEVLDLVPEDRQLACIWAISAARRRANIDELDAAWSAAFHSYSAAAWSLCRTTWANNVLTYAAKAARYVAYNAARTGKDDNEDVCSAAAYAAYREEQKNQCDIIRKHFTIDQVREAFNKLVA